MRKLEACPLGCVSYGPVPEQFYSLVRPELVSGRSFRFPYGCTFIFVG